MQKELLQCRYLTQTKMKKEINLSLGVFQTSRKKEREKAPNKELPFVTVGGRRQKECFSSFIMSLERNVDVGKKYHYTEEEIKFIENNWKSHTDKEIARALNRTEESVSRQRKKYKWIKVPGRPSRESVRKATFENVSNNPTPFSLVNLDKNQRIEIYKQNFEKNYRYSYVKKELTLEELEYYKFKYIDFMDSVETITTVEEDALHHMIMTDINISRIRKHIKEAEEKRAEDDIPIAYGIYEALEKSEKRFIEYQKILNVTRAKRLDKEREHKLTIVTVVQSYRDKMARQETGRQAGLMELYMEKCKKDMSKNRYLLSEDG